MKRRISDMLDACGAPDLEFDAPAPLSAERIRVLTMEKIQKKKRSSRLGWRVLAAAAIMAALAVTALAAGNGGAWFRAFFEMENETPLTDAQIAFIGENAVPVGQCGTIDGYTLDLESVLNDEKTLYIKLDLYAPEGVALPYEEQYSFGELTLLADGEERPWEFWGYEELDGDDTDNHVEFLMSLRFADGVDMAQALTLRLTDLDKTCGSFFERRTERLATGTWEFSIGPAGAEDPWHQELVSAPVACVMEKNETGEETEIFLTSVCMRSMGMDVVYDYPDGWDLERLDWLGQVRLVKKDGTVLGVMPTDGSIEPGKDRVTGYMSFEPDAPIVPEEIAWVEFPGGVQLPVGQQ